MWEGAWGFSTPSGGAVLLAPPGAQQAGRSPNPLAGVLMGPSLCGRDRLIKSLAVGVDPNLQLSSHMVHAPSNWTPSLTGFPEVTSLIGT